MDGRARLPVVDPAAAVEPDAMPERRTAALRESLAAENTSAKPAPELERSTVQVELFVVEQLEAVKTEVVLVVKGHLALASVQQRSAEVRDSTEQTNPKQPTFWQQLRRDWEQLREAYYEVPDGLDALLSTAGATTALARMASSIEALDEIFAEDPEDPFDPTRRRLRHHINEVNRASALLMKSCSVRVFPALGALTTSVDLIYDRTRRSPATSDSLREPSLQVAKSPVLPLTELLARGAGSAPKPHRAAS